MSKKIIQFVMENLSKIFRTLVSFFIYNPVNTYSITKFSLVLTEQKNNVKYKQSTKE